MIEPMMKIRFLVHTEDKKKSLVRLQNLGLVALEIKSGKSSLKIYKLKKKLARYQDSLEKLESLVKNSTNQSKFPETIHTFHQKLLFLEKKINLREEKKLALDEMNHLIANLQIWGNINWDTVNQLRENGIELRFYKTTQSILDKTNPTYSKLIKVNQIVDSIYLLCIDFQNQKDDFSFEQIVLSETSLEELEKERKILEKSKKEDEQFLSGFKSSLRLFHSEIMNLKSNLSFEEAKINLENSSNGIVFSIQGWLPVVRSSEVVKTLKEYNMSYEILEFNEKDSVPILLRNNRFTKIFEPITRIFSLPKYIEIDPTFFFAPFFMIFFGLSLGDLGYGFILFLASSFFWLKSNETNRLYSLLSICLSLSTMVCGIFLNSIFGEPIFLEDSTFIRSEWFHSARDLAIFSPEEVNGKMIYPAMSLSLVLGFIQVSIGMILQACNRTLQMKNILYSIKPISVLGMIWGGLLIAVRKDFLELGLNSNFKVGIFFIGNWLHFIPEFMGLILFYVGLFGFVFFHDPSKSFFLRPILGIWEFYQLITGLLGDILSYIRLFALGLASGLLGNAFNKVALLILPDGNLSSPWIVVSIFILILGHSLNFGLGLLGSFVHPLRLTFVEFYKNMNFTGGGKEFKPFAISK